MTSIFNRLGPYEIVREIGRGGMALVLLATDTRSARQVALKLVPQGTDREGQEILEAEEWGATLQQQFSQVSSHVPAVYEHGRSESGYFFVAMEYLDGENLSDVISRGALPVDRAVSIAADICRFLETAHGFEATIGERHLRSLVHGDLKPRNVRVTSSQTVKVLDFGIAKALSLSRKVTRNDFGTMPYLSPERLESGDVDEYSDLWAVGVMLYEMVRGSTPFQAPDTRRLEQLIRSRRPAPSLSGACPVGVEAIVAKLLAADPAARYETAGNIREDVERFQSGARTRAEEEGWPHRAVDEPPTRRTLPPAPADDDRTRRTRQPDVVPPPLPAHASDNGPASHQTSSPPPIPRRGANARRILRWAFLVIAILMIVNEFSVARAAGQIANAAALGELDQIADVWNEYRGLARRSYLGIGMRRLERSLTERTLALADRVIANYRTPTPTVREAQWQLARNALARAIAAGGGDRRRLEAALRYCDGHLHRINGEASKGRDQAAAAQHHLTAAVVAFREAAELRPGWPDPFLGLARTFIYGLEDVDRGADALRQAQQYGYEPNEREIAQLADGYRARGTALVRSARQLAGVPQEQDYLTRAADAFRQALSLYARAGSFANVPSNIRVAQRALDQVEDRLDALSRAALPPDAIPAPAIEPEALVPAPAGEPPLPSKGPAFYQEFRRWL